MVERLFKKGLVVGIIILFIGVSVQPAFANNNNISVGKIEQQPGSWPFMRTFGFLGAWGRHVEQTDDGGYIITGQKRFFGERLPNTWLIKIHRFGFKMWDRTLTGGCGGRCVQQTSDGGYIVVSNTLGHSPPGDDENYDALLIKTNSNGQQIWCRTFDNANWDRFNYVQQTTDGGYIITGQKGGQLWLLKTNADGKKEWARTYESGEGNCVHLTSDGGYIISGGINDGWSTKLIKTDKSGYKEWSRLYGQVEGGPCVQQTTDGGYIITGGQGLNGIPLIKLNETGVLEWEKTFGQDWWDDGYFVQQTSDGGYIIVGSKSLTEEFKTDVWLIKTDSAGNKTWDRIYGELLMDLGVCVQQTSDGGYIITGRTGGFFLSHLLLIKTDKDGNVKSKSVTNNNLLLLRLLDRFPLLQRLLDVWRSFIV